eukprot:TRINITY_DN55862_c0_g1_i1.p2 TRINITY_DN55862_c0_g1~~TRINITY_DN55862_c0_g1_i1.p2  ORF type:complete len:100 (+),score=21.47 TRINITY_DN55862_c0_g1_i1:158-457(+)
MCIRDSEKAVETQAGKRPVPGVPGMGAKGDKTEYTAMDLYNLELMYRIQQNWAFNERVAKAEKGIEARVLIKILKNGNCLLYTSPSPRDLSTSRMPSSA